MNGARRPTTRRAPRQPRHAAVEPLGGPASTPRRAAVAYVLQPCPTPAASARGPACAEPAVVTLTYEYGRSQVWIDDLTAGARSARLRPLRRPRGAAVGARSAGTSPTAAGQLASGRCSPADATRWTAADAAGHRSRRALRWLASCGSTCHDRDARRCATPGGRSTSRSRSSRGSSRSSSGSSSRRPSSPRRAPRRPTRCRSRRCSPASLATWIAYLVGMLRGVAAVRVRRPRRGLRHPLPRRRRRRPADRRAHPARAGPARLPAAARHLARHVLRGPAVGDGREAGRPGERRDDGAARADGLRRRADRRGDRLPRPAAALVRGPHVARRRLARSPRRGSRSSTSARSSTRACSSSRSSPAPACSSPTASACRWRPTSRST